MPRPSAAQRASAVVALAGCLALAGCSGPKPAGPDVKGLNLADAEHALKKANVGYSEHAKDATFGVLVPTNFVVCDVKYVSKHMVRLEVAKHGC